MGGERTLLHGAEAEAHRTGAVIAIGSGPPPPACAGETPAQTAGEDAGGPLGVLRTNFAKFGYSSRRTAGVPPAVVQASRACTLARLARSVTSPTRGGAALPPAAARRRRDSRRDAGGPSGSFR